MALESSICMMLEMGLQFWQTNIYSLLIFWYMYTICRFIRFIFMLNNFINGIFPPSPSVFKLYVETSSNFQRLSFGVCSVIDFLVFPYKWTNNYYALRIITLRSCAARDATNVCIWSTTITLSCIHLIFMTLTNSGPKLFGRLTTLVSVLYIMQIEHIYKIVDINE